MKGLVSVSCAVLFSWWASVFPDDDLISVVLFPMGVKQFNYQPTDVTNQIGIMGLLIPLVISCHYLNDEIVSY